VKLSINKHAKSFFAVCVLTSIAHLTVCALLFFLYDSLDANLQIFLTSSLLVISGIGLFMSMKVLEPIRESMVPPPKGSAFIGFWVLVLLLVAGRFWSGDPAESRFGPLLFPSILIAVPGYFFSLFHHWFLSKNKGGEK